MNRTLFAILVLSFLSIFFAAPRQIYASITEICDDNSPRGKPQLISAVSEGNNSVKLTWSEAEEPITHYLVAYGRSETEIEYGNPNIGGRGTTTYTVGELAKGVKYYFKVRPVNGCRPGDFSNKLSATPGTTAKSNVPGRVVSNMPKLSIYRPVLAASTSATATASANVEVKTSTILAEKSPQCSACVSWQLLLAETLLLVVYLYLAKKFTFIKPIFSIAIPVGMYILFWEINKECSLSQFTCKYFLPLESIIFVTTVIVYKKMNENIKENDP